MPWKKGESGNKKGRPRKATKSVDELRKVLQNLIESNLSTIEQDFLQLSTEKRLEFILKALRYILPLPLHPIEKLSDEQVKQILQDLTKNN